MGVVGADGGGILGVGGVLWGGGFFRDDDGNEDGGRFSHSCLSALLNLRRLLHP